jgi:hypothetical protein
MPSDFRHAVWNAEKTGCIPREIAEERRNSADFALKPGPESVLLYPAGKLCRPFSEGATGSPVSVNPLGACNAITSR